MLRIHEVCLELVKEVTVLAEVIGKHDRDLCRQLKRSSMSVVQNVGEGSAVRDGRRRTRYGDALGSAIETRCSLEAAVAVGYIRPMLPAVRNHLAQVIGTLVKVTRR